jgi:hypothetical protein
VIVVVVGGVSYSEVTHTTSLQQSLVVLLKSKHQPKKLMQCNYHCAMCAKYARKVTHAL